MFRSRSRTTVLLLSGLAALALAVGPGTAALAAPAAPAHADAATTTLPPINYVALGDSYSAGYGLPINNQQKVPGCAQSLQNYPTQVAKALNLSLTDVTCSGAVTANVIDTPQVTSAGTAAPQSDALNASTNIVTITIGGNDLGFAPISESCVALTKDGPTLESLVGNDPVSNCKATYFPTGGTDSLAARITDTVAPAVANTLAVIHQKAPNAKVFVLGYPAIAPEPTTSCFTSLIAGDGGYTTNAYPFTDIDVPYLHQVEANLDTAIQTATLNAGDTFLPLFAATQGNTPCAGNPAAYINGMTLSATGPGIPITIPTNPPQTVYLEYGALHPNAAGSTFMTGQAATAIHAALAAPAFTSAAPSHAIGGQPYSFQVSASGFPAPTFAVTSGALPAGLNLNAVTGAITGTPTALGSSTFTITATNGVGQTASPEYTIDVHGTAPAVTSAAPPAATVGTAYSFQVTASGFPAPAFHVTSGALPDGLSLDAATGAITGTPTKAGSFAFAITADNSVRPAATAKYTVAVSPAAVPAAVVTKATLANTGSDVVPAGLLAGIVLLTGVALLVVWRVAARK